MMPQTGCAGLGHLWSWAREAIQDKPNHGRARHLGQNRPHVRGAIGF